MNASARPNHRAHVQTTARPPRTVFNLGVQTGKNSCPEPAKVVVAEHPIGERALRLGGGLLRLRAQWLRLASSLRRSC